MAKNHEKWSVSRLITTDLLVETATVGLSGLDGSGVLSRNVDTSNSLEVLGELGLEVSESSVFKSNDSSGKSDNSESELHNEC